MTQLMAAACEGVRGGLGGGGGGAGGYQIQSTQPEVGEACVGWMQEAGWEGKGAQS